MSTIVSYKFEDLEACKDVECGRYSGTEPSKLTL